VDRRQARRHAGAGARHDGSLQADAFLFDHLVKPGDAVIVEKPTYDERS